MAETTIKFDMNHVAQHMCRCAGLPMEALTGRPAYSYTGLDYSLVLHASFPQDVVPLSNLCWSESPIGSQLDGNIRVFLQAAQSLQIPSLPFPREDVFRGPGGGGEESLRSEPANVSSHIAVQKWLFQLGQRFPVDSGTNGAAVRSEHGRKQGALALRSNNKIKATSSNAVPAASSSTHLLCDAAVDDGSYNSERSKHELLRKELLQAAHAAYSSLAADGAVDWARVLSCVDKK